MNVVILSSFNKFLKQDMLWKINLKQVKLYPEFQIECGIFMKLENKM